MSWPGGWVSRVPAGMGAAGGGVTVRFTEYPGAVHGFLAMPGVEKRAKNARAETL